MSGIVKWVAGVGAVLALALTCAAAWNWFLPLPGAVRDSAVFSDCDVCPEMLPVATGSYAMGEPTRIRHKLLGLIGIEAGPRRVVTVSEPFALGRAEVTFDEWAACVAEDGCDGHVPADEGWGREDRPVIHVSWHNAQAYVRWLSQKTGQRYRLPTEAEWEYAARAGTRLHPYPWGRFASHDKASYGEDDCPPCTGVVSGRDVWEGTAPVASFPPNGWGFYDMNGNVYEWTQDCLAPLEPGAFGQDAVTVEACEEFVMRGGAWYSDPGRITNFYRSNNPPDKAGWVMGFRVARDM
jgi:formylglycine-generating enzyme required for sulfatase activity